MISKPCDRCDRMIEVDDDKAGTKVECPHCGDTNIMPGKPAGDDAPAAGPTSRRRPEDLGLPPDSGPEKQVMLVRPALMRSRPVSFIAATLLGATGLVLASINLISPTTVKPWMAIIAVLALIGAFGLIIWWWVQTLSAALEITNKRTVAKRGLLSRSTSEVVHDNIRNVQVDQSFWERIWKVGSIGISSSGQDGIEIQMRKIPNPQKLRETIDLYRPLD
jgi:DNA-directed RNA polymerase subunit RPC12/RpoP